MNSIHRFSLVMLAFLLVACGRPDTQTIASVTPKASNSDVEKLLRNRPALNQEIELTAYAVRIGQSPAGGIPGGNGMCWLQTLTDVPIPSSVRTLDRETSGPPPDTMPWLNAISRYDVNLPHYARFRGHFADPAQYFNCPSSAPIFVVDDILEVYEKDLPQNMQLPREISGIDSWLHYRDNILGYDLIYPPDWVIEPTKDSSGLPLISMHSPQFVDHPIKFQVYKGATYLDPQDADNSPELVRGGSAVQQNNIHIARQIATQGIWATVVHRVDQEKNPIMAAVFTGGGYTYDFSIMYAEGLAVPQSILDTFSVMVAGFQLDKLPEPTPNPVKQSIDQSRTYLNKDEALKQAQQVVQANYGYSSFTIVDMQLLSEQEARRAVQNCSIMLGHPNAVWIVTVFGQMSGRAMPSKIGIDAETGNLLCGEFTQELIQPTDTNPTIDPITATAIEQSKALTPGITPEVITPEPTAAPTWPADKGPTPVLPTVVRTPVPAAP